MTLLPALARGQWAAPSAGREIGILVDGANREAVGKVIEESLGAGFLVTDAMTIREALALSGRKTIGARPKDRGAVAADVARACAEAGIDGLIYGHVSGSAKSGYDLWLFVVDRDGKVLLDQVAAIGVAKKRNKKWTVRWNLEAVSNLAQPGIDALRSVPAPSGPRPEKKVAVAGEGPPARPSPPLAIKGERRAPGGRELTRLSAPFALRASVDVGSREFTYHQPVSSNLRSYSVAFAPLFGLSGEGYPFAAAHVAVLSQLGWFAEYAQAFQVQSTFASAAGPPVKNVWREWQVGMRGRIPVGSSFGATLQGTYGHHGYSFRFGEDDEREREVPDVRYNMLRAGLELRQRFDVFDAYVGVGYRHVLSGGRVTNDYFPRADVAAVDASAGVGFAVLRRLSIELGAEYTRYFYDLRPQPWDRYVAGGALDQYMAGTVALVYLVGEP